LWRPSRAFHALAALTAGLLGWLMVLPYSASANAQDGLEEVNQAKEIHGDELYQPSVGQEGKHVIWIPTPDALVQAMLDIVKIQPNDILYDLGSGDGKIVIAAAKRYTIKAVGIEYNPDLVSLARRNALRAGVEDRARFIQGDIFKEDFSKASVLALYLLPDLNLKLKPIILAMPPGTRVVSNTFDMGSWPADATIELDPSNRAYYWVVPARVQGRWQLDDPAGTALAELELRQDFQLLSGSMLLGGERFSIVSGRMQGEAITFSYGRSTPAGSTVLGSFQGTVQAGLLEGSLSEAGKPPQPAAGQRLEPGPATNP
jgi:Methylase of polypeptide chain release factors